MILNTNKRFQYLIYFILWVLCSSCIQTQRDFQKELRKFSNTYTLIENGKIIIPIDSITQNIGAFQYFEDKVANSKYFCLLNNNSNKLQLYRWPTGDYYNAISLPNGVGAPSHFYIHNLDSIYLVDGHFFRLSLINSSGALLKSYRLLKDVKDYENIEKHPPPLATAEKYCGTPVPDNRNPIQVIGDSLFIRCYPWMDPFKSGYFEIGKVKLGLNLKTNQIFYFMSYPDLFLNKDESFPTQLYNESCTYNEITTKFVFSFPADNYVYEVSPIGLDIQKYWAGSRYFEEVKPLTKKTTDNIKHAEHTFNNFHFERICFDKFRNVYYRLVWQPDSSNKFAFSNPEQTFRPRLSIAILDNEFKHIGETLLPISVTNTFMFPAEEGLYIQSDIDNTSQISFTLFSLVTL